MGVAKATGDKKKTATGIDKTKGNEMAAGIGKESGNTKAKIAKTTVSSYAKTNATTERIEKTIGTKKARGNAKEARDAK